MNSSPADWIHGYCTNVHAGATLTETRRQLEKHAVHVRELLSSDEPLGIGLWLSASAARQLLSGDALPEFRRFLDDSGLRVFTMNGFPFGDFHSSVVKHRVYEPTWLDPRRIGYTRDLIRILHDLLPAGEEGSISTLPIAWGAPAPTADRMFEAAANLRGIAETLEDYEEKHGRLIYLCLEPEPGCVLQRSPDVVDLFERYLDESGDSERNRRYLRVCHDVCHAEVMFEEQEDVLHGYRDSGIRVGKIQISSAVRVPFGRLSPEDRAVAREQLAGFVEPRYLHQTVIRRETPPLPGSASPSAEESFYEDLPTALNQIPEPTGDWRVHFHVPVYLERFGHVETSRPGILECLRVARELPELKHLEVETYAWNVLPEELKQPSLAQGIADELRWLAQDALAPEGQ